MNFSNWATMPVSLAANVVQGINLPLAANLIMIRNPDTTNSIYISATANISSTIRDSVANVGNYGFLVRPMPLRTFYLLSAGDISGVEVFFITVDKPLDFLHLMAQPPTQLAAITSSALPSGASTEATQLLVKVAALAIQAAVEGTLDVQLSGSNVAEDGSVKTTMTSALDSDFDSINVDKMGKGGVTTIHSAIADTATSDEIDCRGYNAILVEAGVFSAAENWTFKVQGCMVSGGTFVDWYEQANTGTMTLMSYQCNAARGFVFKGIPDYVKIVATRDGGASAVTVKVQPLNV